MSHVHNLGANSTAAAEYQDYLARMAANRPAPRKTPGQVELRTFDSAIETEQDASKDPGEEAEPDANPRNADGPGDEAEGKSSWSVTV